MGKHEHPPFRMVIEGGKLVPATAYDAERLDTYRRGTEVRVTFTEEKDRPLVRKWWAILGLVVKQCDVPWQNKDQASEAIKLALGIVNLSKTVHGQYMQYPKSLTELTEPELEEAVEQMMALIQRMTGIDPETLKKEAKIEDEESSAPPADAAAVSTPPAQNPMDAAAPPSAADTGGDEEAGASVPVEKAAHGEPSAPASEPDDEDKAKIRRMLMEECITNMLRDATSEPAAERLGKIDKGEHIWKGELPYHHGFVEKVAETARRIAAKPGDKAKARDYLLAKVA